MHFTLGLIALATVALGRPAPNVDIAPGSVDTLAAISPSGEGMDTSTEIPPGIFYRCAGPSREEYMVSQHILCKPGPIQ